MRLPVAIAVAIGVFVSTPDPHLRTLTLTHAEAAVSLDPSLGELLVASPLVVLATPLEHRSVWEEDERLGRRIVTYTRVRVERALGGDDAAEQEVWVRTFGGRVGSVGQRVEGEATLVAGEESVLFLQKRLDGTHAVTGMALGHYPLGKADDGKLVLTPSPRAGLVLRKLDETAATARELLAGKTVEEAASIIAKARRVHAR